MAACEDCGCNAGFMASLCGECIGKRNRVGNQPEDRVAQVARDKEISRAAPSVIVTTASHFSGKQVAETIDIVTAECAIAMNIFRDLFAGVSDFFGGRNQSAQQILRDARITCLNEIRREAAMIGGNAVIAVDLDYSEFSGGGKSMLFLVASGTAVKVVDNN